MKKLMTKAMLSFLATSFLSYAFAFEFTPKKPYPSAHVGVSDRPYLHFETRKIALGAGYDINSNAHIYLMHEFKPKHHGPKTAHSGWLGANAFIRFKYKFC